MTPHPAPLAPLRMVALGIVVVALDLNIERVDLLLDPVGYLLVALGLGRLARLHPGFLWGCVAAAVGVLTSTAGTLLRRVPPDGGAVQEHPLVGLADEGIQVVVIIGVCTALIALVRNSRVTGPARTLRIALPVLSLVGAALTLAFIPWDGSVLTTDGWSSAGTGLVMGLTGVSVVLVIVTLALAVWFVIVLLRAAKEPVVDGTAAWVGEVPPDPGFRPGHRTESRP